MVYTGIQSYSPIKKYREIRIYNTDILTPPSIDFHT